MLRHSSDSEPGYTRQRKGRYWAYFDGEKRVTDRDTIDRLNAIALPPAYKDAWFCEDPDGHLQATGIDDRGRKQYRYHPDFRAKAEASKFAGLLEFGKALPKIRRQVDKDLKKRALSKEKVVAAVIRLLDEEISARRQPGICEGQQELRRDDAAQPPGPRRRPQGQDAVQRQEAAWRTK